MTITPAPPVASSPPIGRGFRLVSVVLGLLLFAAAGLKAYGLAPESMGEHTVLSSPRLHIATVEVEILMGIWLVSGLAPRVAWLATLALFSAFGAVSFYLALAGQRSCGCFGELQVNPWLALTLDVLAVTTLIIWRPARPPARPAEGSSRPTIGAVAGTAFLLGIMTIGILLAVPEGWRQAFQGDALAVEPGVSDIGSGAPGEAREVQVRLINTTDRPIRVVGGTVTCNCMTLSSLPITLLPHEAAVLPITVKFEGTSGSFKHQYFLLYVDGDQQREVLASFTGTVTDVRSH
jgi:hypothetical protein